jgi:hypothetical protein
VSYTHWPNKALNFRIDILYHRWGMMGHLTNDNGFKKKKEKKKKDMRWYWMQVMHAPFFQLVEVNYYKGNSEPNTHVIKKYQTLDDFKITAFSVFASFGLLACFPKLWMLVLFLWMKPEKALLYLCFFQYNMLMLLSDHIPNKQDKYPQTQVITEALFSLSYIYIFPE